MEVATYLFHPRSFATAALALKYARNLVKTTNDQWVVTAVPKEPLRSVNAKSYGKVSKGPFVYVLALKSALQAI